MAEKAQSKDSVTESCSSDQLDCAVCLQPCVHPTLLPCNHIFCYLCVKGLGRTTKQCAMCRQEFSSEVLENPQLLRSIDSALETGYEDGQQWFYEGRNGWWQYEERISDDIEGSYLKGHKNVEVLICGEIYVIDLNTYHQYQKSNPSRRRRIKRGSATEVKKKGVAGIPQLPQP